ncbi:unnamed protein product [Arabis nemorensis]|uniref:Transcription factor CBF/NF-Y/archaeal histone domain-containing protein n=1 Tax=Arabis nemorensis TaxID=586526 RepID=A0A565C688_9BRAS|nr:unnamed protein product [Arabis nemorensis]
MLASSSTSSPIFSSSVVKYNMRRPRVANSSLFANASIKASHSRMKPVAQCSHNVMPISDQLWSNHPATSKVKEVSSLENVLKNFWDKQRDQVENFTGFNRQNNLPLSRVRKILKSDPDVKMISREAPALFSKSCEYFILELTLRVWMHTQSRSSQTIRRCDIFQAVKNSKIYDFLIDVVPFGPHCVTHQGLPEHAEPEQVLPSPKMILPEHAEPEQVLPSPKTMILPDMNVPVDMNEIEQENPVTERFIKNKGFDLNLIASEDDSDGSGEEI